MTRREMLVAGAAGAAAPWLAAAAPSAGARSSEQVPAAPRPATRPEGPPPLPPGERFGLAVCGLGAYALEQIIPSLAESRSVRLAGVVTGDPAKGRETMLRYGGNPDAVVGYDEIGKLPADAEGVYVITPNALHRRDTLAALAAGRHVLCEKPMATSIADAEAMITAAKRADRRLMMGYRAHFEPFHRRTVELVRGGELGRVSSLTGDHGRILDPREKRDVWRMDRALAGGGSLMDIGIYNVNGFREYVGEEPTEVSAELYSPPGDPRFREVEDTVTWTFRYPSGAVARGASSYSWAETKRFAMFGDRARLDLDPATDYYRHGLVLEDREGKREPKISEGNQFAAQMDHFAECVRENRPFRSPAEMGLRDLRLLFAIYESAGSGRTVRLRG